MAKPLSQKELQKRKNQKKAIENYFGERIPEQQYERIYKSIRANSSKDLNEEERRAFWCIQTNLIDKIYTRNLEVC